MNHRLLTVHCLSPLHCGSGQGVAGIDLPVIRERHTGWPLIPGSSMKGVLRDAFRSQKVGGDADKANADGKTIALFGPEPRGAEGELGLGALVLGDAVLLAFPVRSLVGVFAWCTCPMALSRIGRLPGGEELARLELPSVVDDDILCDESLIAHDKKVILEDHALTQKNLPEGFIDYLKPLWTSSAQPMLIKHIAIISDTLFSWFAKHATQVEARIALDPATKTVNDGQLFYEETVPPETVFMAPIAAENARHIKADKTLGQAEAALDALKDLTDGKTLQFGGKATIGRGQCALRLSGGK